MWTTECRNQNVVHVQRRSCSWSASTCFGCARPRRLVRSLALSVPLLASPGDASADLIRDGRPPPAIQPGQPTTPRPPNASIKLTERMSVAVPQGRLLRNAALSPSGELIVAWFHADPGVRVYRGVVATDILAHEVGRAIGVGFLDEARLEIVDAAAGAVVVADTAGDVLSRRWLPTARGASAAARTVTGWFLALPGSAPPRIQLPGGRGAWTPDSTYMRTLALAAGDDEVIVWQSSSPFHTWRIGMNSVPAELERITPGWFADDVAHSLRLDAGIWSSTSVVAVGSGYVQTMAHRGTDRRLLLWFDSLGRFVRHAAMDAPFGLVASAADAPVVLAVRTLNTTELVKYSWESTPDSP